KMAELAAAQFSNTGARLIVANRSRTRGEKLADRFGAVSRSLDDLEELIQLSDVVIASTGSRRYLFDDTVMNTIMKRRKFRPIFLIDIAVPRNLDPKLNRIDGVYLYDLDALSSITQENVRKRQSEANAASELVRLSVDKVKQDARTDALKPAIIAVRKSVLALSQAEVEHVTQKFKVPDEQKAILERLATNIANKVLHSAIEELKRDAGSPEHPMKISAIMNALQAGEIEDE
ncbi:MAG: hypothetical protein ACPGQS_08190, partial [Bradymonadia bacterium]